MEKYRKYNQKYNQGKNSLTYSTERVEYHKTIEKRTIPNIGKEISTGYKQYTSFSKKDNLNKQGNKNELSNSFSLNKKQLNNSFSSQQKYSYAGKVNEKNNYVYYVSGIGYVNKNEDNKNEKNINNKKTIKPAPPKTIPKPVAKPNQIKIQQKKVIEVDRKQLVDNYQYHETKDIKKETKKSTVNHQRLCEPFYSEINTRNSKKFSSYTEQPRTLNKSYQRPEYEIKEQRKPILKNESNKFNYPTEKYSGNLTSKYIPNNLGNQSDKNYNRITENKRKNSYKIEEISQKRSSNYINNRRDAGENKSRSYISNNNNNEYLQQNRNRTKNEKNNEIKTNTRVVQNYNNINRHEIKVENKYNNIRKNYSTENNIIEKKSHVSKVTNIQNNSKPNYTININRRNKNENRTREINQRINRTKNINDLSGTQKSIQAYSHNKNNYAIEPVKQIQHVYEINRKEFIPQQMTQITYFETENINRAEPSNLQIEMRQRSQNIPQQVQEIEVHDTKEIKENIPQHVQQIEVHDENNQVNQGEIIEKNEQVFQNIEERNIEENNEEQEDVKQEQEINQENNEEQEYEKQEQEINQENNEEKEYKNQEQEINQENQENIEEQEEKNIEIEQNIQENQQQNEMMSNNENIQQSDEKEGNEQIEEKSINENQDEKFQIQQISFNQYIPQENNIRNEEYFQINRNQSTNNRFSNEMNYINYDTQYCPVHGIYHNPVNQNNIYNVHGHYHNKINNMNAYNLNPEISEDGIIRNTNNYRFYESKNIRNEGDINSFTLHHLRDGNKYLNSKESNVYVATRVIPIIQNSNYMEYNQSNEFNNNIENTHFHMENEDCPVHGKKFVIEKNN